MADAWKSPSTTVNTPGRLIFIAGVWFAIVGGLLEAAVAGSRRLILHQRVLLDPDLIWIAPLTGVLLNGILVFILAWVADRWPRLPMLRPALFASAFVALIGPLLMLTEIGWVAATLLGAGLAFQASHFVYRHPARFEAVVRYTLCWPWLGAKQVMRALRRGPRAQPPVFLTASPVSSLRPHLTRRQTLLSGAASIAGLAVGLRIYNGTTEMLKLSSLPPPRRSLPNLLWIVMDTVRSQSLSLYGYARQTTPQLQSLASRGVVFERALAPAPWTLPSHASMFTGKYPHQLTSNWASPLSDRLSFTIAELLDAKGYATAGFVANTYYGTSQFGLAQGFAHYDSYPFCTGELALGSSLGRTIASSYHVRRAIGYNDALNRQSSANINRNFLDWQARGTGGRPFFAFLNYFDAHDPYFPPAPFNTMFGPLRPRGPFGYQTPGWTFRASKAAMTPDQVQTELDAYEGAIASVDHQIGNLVDELERRGVLDNTLLVITADHGEEFGEHGVFDHGTTLYMTPLHVPLMLLFGSRLPVGTSVSAPVTLRDLSATALELMGLRTADWPGVPLTRYWDQTAAPSAAEPGILCEVSGPVDRLAELGLHYPPEYPVKPNNMRSIVLGDHHYIRDAFGNEQVYHYVVDPLEHTDLVKTGLSDTELAPFRSAMNQLHPPDA
jgi:arylsulfatase A-like enzyme